MSVLITGITLDDFIQYGGEYAAYLDGTGCTEELPDHGDLIDREYAIGSACSGIIRTLPTTEGGENWIRVEEVRQSLKSVPVVIPAERS